MSFIIDLDPQLGILPDEFIAAWNGDAAARQLAIASEDPSPPRTFAEPVSTLVLAAAIGLGFNLLEKAIEAVVKKLLDEKKRATIDVPENASMIHHKNPDGSELITITIPPKNQIS